ncbi:nucleoside/nucleotide kinase family protein [Oerskovia flava]|uniref:nucleoside/nucleotide kinase family protein n=1 Tax=Oerskovia flava TaxID=2986422 RepID=UPI00223FAD05|nr:nucleoside/nucleotide kinase family protein [Oerskovia sp. JB1-3-2]
MEETTSADLVRVEPVERLVERAAALVARGGRSLLGVVGAPGAGKSTLCDELVRVLGADVAVVGMDAFHLADEVLAATGRLARKGAPDTFDVAGYVALLDRLRRNDEDVVYAPRFDRRLEASVAGAVPVPSGVPLVVTEGNYLLGDAGGWERVRGRLDTVWYLDLPASERVERLTARRVSYGHDEDAARDWVRTVDESNADVVAATRARADLVVRLAPPGDRTASARHPHPEDLS